MTGRIVLLGLGAALGAAAPAMAQDSATAPASASPKVVTVRNISRMELSPGVAIVDGSGNTIGTVKTVAGNTVVVTDGSADYSLPITELYAYSDGAADRFASRVPKAALQPAQKGG